MEIRAATSEERPWLLQRTGAAATSAFRAIVALDDAGRVRGAIGFDSWTESGVQAHMAVDTPIAWRHLLGPAFAYPFKECDKSVISGCIAASNLRSLQMASHLGFEYVGRIQDGHAVGDDWVVIQMHRSRCRWLGRQGAIK